jgi:hypothetical protein
VQQPDGNRSNLAPKDLEKVTIENFTFTFSNLVTARSEDFFFDVDVQLLSKDSSLFL